MIATLTVIPAQAGIHGLLAFVIMDSRFRGKDAFTVAVEAQKLLGISLEGLVG